MDVIQAECESVINEVCKKYGYNDLDQEKNDSLKTVLLKCVPIMLDGRKTSDRELFYQMLEHTPIVITDAELTKEEHDKIIEKYIGNTQPNIIENQKQDLGEYGKGVAEAEYYSSSIIDENLKIKGKKSFIHIGIVSNKSKEFLNTEVNVPHLIHELGHAWHSEKDESTSQEDGTIKLRQGTCESIYSYKRQSDGKYLENCEKTSYLMIEEEMNTIAEEIAMAHYMGIPREEMQDAYKTYLVPSAYQTSNRYIVEKMIKIIGKEVFEKWRLEGDETSKNKINSVMEKTDYWKNREQEIQPGSKSKRNYNIKRKIMSEINDEGVQNFFRDNDELFFPNISEMTPLDKIENVLEQRFNINLIKYRMTLDMYKKMLDCIIYEDLELINQTESYIAKERENYEK